MSSAICVFSRGEDAVTSTSEDVHHVARHRLTGERNLLLFLALCHFHEGAHGPPCNLSDYDLFPWPALPTQSGKTVLR